MWRAPLAAAAHALAIAEAVSTTWRLRRTRLLVPPSRLLGIVPSTGDIAHRTLTDSAIGSVAGCRAYGSWDRPSTGKRGRLALPSPPSSISVK